MAVKHIDLDDKYIPKTNDQDIVIDVIIGNAADAVSSYSIFLGTDSITDNAQAILGNKAKVIGKKATISAVIPDVLKESNWTSMTVNIVEGGNTTQLGPYNAEVEEHLDHTKFCFQTS